MGGVVEPVVEALRLADLLLQLLQLADTGLGLADQAGVIQGVVDDLLGGGGAGGEQGGDSQGGQAGAGGHRSLRAVWKGWVQAAGSSPCSARNRSTRATVSERPERTASASSRPVRSSSTTTELRPCLTRKRCSSGASSSRTSAN